MKIEINDREHATILAALRWWQLLLDSEGCHRSSRFLDISTNCGEVDPLDEDEVDNLCFRINTEYEE